MTSLRIALAQVNPTVGDLAGNARIVIDTCQVAARSGAQLVAFPEMMLTGYPIEDLALRPSFIEASRATAETLAVDLLAEGMGTLTVVVGLLDGREGAVTELGTPRNEPVNAAWVMHGGRVVARYAKHHLPNYGVFDEYRYFVPGDTACVVDVDGARVSLAICEDLWQDGGPVEWTQRSDADLLLVINGSPYERAKDDVRLALCAQRAREAGCTLAYVNMVGGQDELVFDGDSMIVTAAGTVVGRAPQFEPYLLVASLDLDATADVPDEPVAPHDPSRDDLRHELITGGAQLSVGSGSHGYALSADAEVYAALVVGLRDYVRKNGFASVVLGLSGGIDSALVAAIAGDAIGATNVHGVSLPSRYSSQHSKDDAADSAQRSGMPYRTITIEPMVQSFQSALHLTGLAEENLQARVRGVTLMGISNSEGHLVLATGNKTELSVGYSTIYGDAVGGFAPIKDLPKRDVWQLSRWRNQVAEARNEPEPIPRSSIEKPPSAELRPGQLDTDSLPDYLVLDDLLDDYVELDRGAAYLIEQGFEAHLVERVLHLTDAAEYKRRQYPPGTKVSLRAFGRDRRLPITNRWRERPS
jgi:NAD+ synthase (glutamine-hydrolysing)